MFTCLNSGNCIFDEQPVQTDIQSSKLVDYHPISDIKGKDIPIQFLVSGTTEEYIDCQDINLELTLKITKANGKDIVAADKVGLTNLSIASLFQDVSLTLNDKQIEGGNRHYPFAAYFSTLSQFQAQAKGTHLRTWGWQVDQPEKFDDETNTGLVERMNWSAGSKEFQLKGPIFLDFFRQPRYLISNINMRLTFIRAKPEFALMAFGADKYKIDITSATLFVRKCLMNPSVINDHNKGLKSENAKYPVNHCLVNTYTIPSGMQSDTRDNLFPVQQPKALYIAMIENDAYNGDYKKNPFHFQDFGLTNLGLYADGSYIVHKDFTPDIDNDMYMREYNATMSSLGMYNTDDSNGITYFAYGHGSFFIMIDLTPDCNLKGNNVYPTKPGNLRLELKFKAATAETINVLLYAVYDAKVEITELRDILPSYQR